MASPIFAGNFILRPASPDDYNGGMFDLLSQLTISPQCDQSLYLELISDNNISIYVTENIHSKQIVATMRLNFERKLIRNGGTVCHFEDFVVDKDHRKHGIGGWMIQSAQEIAKNRGCYKMLGICADALMPYYQKQGFEKTGFVFGKYY